MRHLLIPAGFMLLLLSIGACEIINPPEDIPAYLYLDGINLETDINQGSNNHEMEDAWVYVDTQLIGVYTVPGLVPILQEGPKVINVFGGVRDNGIVVKRTAYPMYEDFETNVDLIPGQVDSITPIVNYYSNVQIPIIEEFESGQLFIQDRDGNDDTRIVSYSGDSFEGDASGRILLDEDNSIIEVTTPLTYAIDADGIRPIYLELNYKNNINFEIGVIGYRNLVEVGSTIKITLFAKDEWNKIYINLTEEMFQLNCESFKVYFKAIHNSGLSQSEILLDNIKLVHF